MTQGSHHQFGSKVRPSAQAMTQWEVRRARPAIETVRQRMWVISATQSWLTAVGTFAPLVEAERRKHDESHREICYKLTVSEILVHGSGSHLSMRECSRKAVH